MICAEGGGLASPGNIYARAGSEGLGADSEDGWRWRGRRAEALGASGRRRQGAVRWRGAMLFLDQYDGLLDERGRDPRVGRWKGVAKAGWGRGRTS